jgi:hypothetical protein
MIRLLTKDNENIESLIYPIYIYSHKTYNINDFFGCIDELGQSGPINLYKNTFSYDKIVRYMNILLKYNVV